MSDRFLNDILTTAEESFPPETQLEEHNSTKTNSVPAELLCPRCLELYEMPLFLPCSHTFCQSCTKSLISTSDEVMQQRNRFICPTCRNIIKYGPEGVDCLPRNVNLEQAVTRFKLESKLKHPECVRHQQFNMQLIMWCQDCGHKLCPLCALEDTHKEHKIAPIKVFLRYKDMRQRLKQATKNLSNKMETIGADILDSGGIVQKIEGKAEELKKRVDKECDEMARQVEARRKNMYKDIERAIQKKQCRKREEIESLKSEYVQTKALVDRVESVLQEHGPAEFMKRLKDSRLIDELEELSSTERNS